MSLYTKNNNGEFVPIEISKVINKDLNNHLVVVRVGSDEHPASMSDVDLTESSLGAATVLDDLDNISVIVTPYQIDVDLINDNELDTKTLCVQITGGEDAGLLDSAMKIMYRRLKKNYGDVVVLPSPLTLKDYRQVQDTLKRCKMRKSRRTHVKISE